MKTSINAGIIGCFWLAGRIELKRVRGVPIPDRRHSLTKPEKFAIFHKDEIPRAPTIAMAGVALKINRPADHAI